MIWFIVGLFLGGLVMTAVMACLCRAGQVDESEGRSRHIEYLEKLICTLAKHYPCKLWDSLTPAVRDECMRIIEKSYRENWRIE